MNTLELDASFAKARVEGTFLPTLLWDLAENTVYSVFPALRDEVDYDHAEQWFNFDVVTGESDAVLDLFAPGLSHCSRKYGTRRIGFAIVRYRPDRFIPLCDIRHDPLGFRGSGA